MPDDAPPVADAARGDMSFKRIVKTLGQQSLAGSRPALLVASMGRAGSTLVYNAAIEGMVSSRFASFAGLGKRLVSDTAWDLGSARLHGGVIYKTHDFPYALADGVNAKAVFLYGSASETVLSVYECLTRYGRDWIELHLEHLKASGTFEQMLDSDVLRIGEQIDAWSLTRKLDVLGMRYDALWSRRKDIEEFLGVPFQLPPFKPRGVPGVAPAIAEKVRQTYAALDENIAKMPDFFRAGPSMNR